MIPDTPPWLLTPPQVIFDLTQYSKCSTNPAAYCVHFLEIASQFPKATHCAGFTYWIDKMVYTHRHRNIVSNFTTELQATCVSKPY